MTKFLPSSLSTFSLVVLLGLPVLVVAQTAPLQQQVSAYTLDSGVHSGQEGQAAATYTAYTRTVRIPDAPWLRLTFSDVELGANSYLTVTSVADGAQQRLNTETIAQWQNTSAYFNGDAVRVALHVGPGDEGVFVRMNEVIAGLDGAPESQCGPVDDRMPSDDPKAGRILSVGCTGWIIHEDPDTPGADQIVTAGHCTSGSSVLQFNVPLSTAGGGLQHPGPEDQYTVDFASKVYVNGGVGNDWGVFRVFDNTQTGLQPSEAQGGRYFIRQDLSPPVIRITGYGVDTGSANQTQQTHTGPNAGSFGTTMAYQTDTQGGNSGSPVIDEATGHSVGVHTHGGCTTSGTGSNKGTSLFNTAFWNAVGEPPPLCTLDLVAADLSLEGDRVRIDLTVRNTGSSNVDTQLKLDYNRDGGDPQGTLSLGMGSLPPGIDVDRTIYRSTAGVPSGNYNLTLRLADGDGATCGSYEETIAVSAGRVGGSHGDALFAEAQAAASAAAPVSVAPNPFERQTTISYVVDATADVRLAVYDVLGREVAVLVDGTVEAGLHAATFDARDLAAGTYVYRLVAGTDVEVGRLTLAR